MDRSAISLRILLLANTALAALLGFGLCVSPDWMMDLFHPSPVESDARALVPVLGFLLLGTSLTLWPRLAGEGTEDRAPLAKVVAVTLLVAWLCVIVVASDEKRPEATVGDLLWLGWLPLMIGVFVVLVKSTRAASSAAADPVAESAVQQERSRLARDLHDSIKQQLFSIKLGSAAADERWERDPAGARAALADVRRSAHAAMVEMQAMLSQLRPEPLSAAGLVEALREQCEALGYRSGIPVLFEIGDLPPDSRLAAGTQENLFRIAQEALSNVAHHARAREVRVHLGQAEGALLLQVRDDGQGFDPAGPSGGMGLRNMRERLEGLRGTLEIRSTPGQGTEVRASVPFAVRKFDSDAIRSLWTNLLLVTVFAAFAPSRPYFSAIMVSLIFLFQPNVSQAVRRGLLMRQYNCILCALAFWWTCDYRPEEDGFSDWLEAVRYASPIFLLLALREAWLYFRLRRSLGSLAPQPAMPFWIFGAMLLALLVSVPCLFLVPDRWVVARVGLVFYGILYLGWRLRTVS